MKKIPKSPPAAAVPAPVIILVMPQIGENIGAAARAMLNCGLDRMRLVRPREAWPNEKAIAAASGADAVLDSARLFDSVPDAIADLDRVYATTARPRDMVKPVLIPRRAIAEMREWASAAPGADGQGPGEGSGIGILFGPERSGLENDDVALADAVIEVPLNPAFSSLNLAQAVLLCAYEWRMAGHEPDPAPRRGRAAAVATKAELAGLYAHLEGELDKAGFLRPPEKRPRMVQNIRNIFARATLTEQEVRTLRGVVSALTRRGGN